MGIELKIYNRFEEIAGFQVEWDDFVEANGEDIFMTFDWCRVWWKYYGKNRDLRIFIFYSNDDLVGIVPLFFEKIWLGLSYIRVVKIVGSDFTLAQFSLPIRDCFLKEVVQGLAEKLYDLDWDIIHVGPIAGIYNSFVELEESLRQSFNSYAEVQSNEQGVQTYFDLEEDWENQLLTLSKRERGDIRRNYRYISKVVGDMDRPIQVQVLTADSDNIQEIFNGFAEMHRAHWAMLDKAGHFGDWPQSFDFHIEMSMAQLGCGRLRLFKVILDEMCLGYEYDYKCGQNYFEILNARTREDRFRNISLGKIVFSEQVKKAINEKITNIDSMRGKYDHKIKMGGKLCPIQSVYIIRKGWLRVIKVQLFRMLSKLYNIGYYKIWFCRVAPKMLKKNRPLNRLWIKTQGFS